MRIFAHVDDVDLPRDAAKDALRVDTSALKRISRPGEISDAPDVGPIWRSALFVLTLTFYDEVHASKAFDVAELARRISCALILPHKGAPGPRAPLVAGLTWVFADFRPNRLRSALLLATQGVCLFSHEHAPRSGSAAMDCARLESLGMLECAVLMHLAGGLSDNAIARELGISTPQVGHFTRHIFEGLGVSSRAEAGAFYLRYRERIVDYRKSMLRDNRSGS